MPDPCTSDGTSYILSGPEQGRLVLCIHGIGGAKFQFDQLAQALVTNGFRVLRYDLMGRGDSAPSENYTAEAHLNQIFRLLKELGLDQTEMDVVAHSMGGALATLFAKKNDSVKKMVLLSPAGMMNLGPLAVVRKWKWVQKPVGKMLRNGQEGAWREDFVDKKGPVAEDCVKRLKEISQRNPKSYDAFYSSALVFPLSGLQSSAEALTNKSVCVLWAEKDKAVPLKPSLARWKSALPNAAFKTYPNLAHGFFMEDASAVNDDVLSFLSYATLPVSTVRHSGA
jgi:pimeloyl-ACP methyl ester carboxylesterase